MTAGRAYQKKRLGVDGHSCPHARFQQNTYRNLALIYATIETAIVSNVTRVLHFALDDKDLRGIFTFLDRGLRATDRAESQIYQDVSMAVRTLLGAAKPVTLCVHKQWYARSGARDCAENDDIQLRLVFGD